MLSAGDDNNCFLYKDGAHVEWRQVKCVREVRLGNANNVPLFGLRQEIERVVMLKDMLAGTGPAPLPCTLPVRIIAAAG